MIEKDTALDLLVLTDKLDSEERVYIGTLDSSYRDSTTFFKICYHLWHQVYKIVVDARRPLHTKRFLYDNFSFEVRAYIPEPSCMNPAMSHLWQFTIEMNKQTSEIYRHIRCNYEYKDPVPTDALSV